jgi:type I restriction enzyme, S subunit
VSGESSINSDAADDGWAMSLAPIPAHWSCLDFDAVFENVPLTGLKIPQKEYEQSGRYPVIDQGAELVGGYTNDADKILALSRPAIVFGDHTKCFKYLSIPFAPGADGIKVLLPKEGILEKYVYHLCKSLRLPDRGYSRHFSFLKKCKFPVPPIDEQKDIVAMIESLLSELDSGIESLKTAREQLKVYRQAVLKHAFEGKLTAQWREENKDKLEPPEQLLARIQQEREARYQQQLEEWKAAIKAWEAGDKEGKKPKRPKAPIRKMDVSSDEVKQLPSLPTGWRWIYPEQIAAPEEHAIGIGPFGSNLKVSDYRDSGVPLIFVRNITRNDFLLNLRYIDNDKFSELYAHSVKPLDLVITKMGDPPGDCEIYPEHSSVAVLTADCLKFRLFDRVADRRFYMYYIKSNFVKRQLGLITKGVAQKKISVERFKTLALPLASYEEQVEIADKIEVVFSLIENQEQVISCSLERAEAFRQSVLKNAFNGRLFS